eukprot:EG_transcript_33441
MTVRALIALGLLLLAIPGPATAAASDCGEGRPALCSLPAVSGPCRGFMPRWYFDSGAGQCKEFIYGGCRGNENSFSSQEDCEAACAAAKKECPPIDAEH